MEFGEKIEAEGKVRMIDVILNDTVYSLRLHKDGRRKYKLTKEEMECFLIVAKRLKKQLEEKILKGG